jgi:hypothetical protein
MFCFTCHDWNKVIRSRTIALKLKNTLHSCCL